MSHLQTSETDAKAEINLVGGAIRASRSRVDEPEIIVFELPAREVICSVLLILHGSKGQLKLLTAVPQQHRECLAIPYPDSSYPQVQP